MPSFGPMSEALLRPSDDHDVIERTARRFARAAESNSQYHYVAIKLQRDPSTRAIAALAPLGEVFDLGCGRGHLALFLLENGSATRARAVDWDEEKIRIAKRAAIGLDASFEAIDIRKVALEKADTVLLVDVLHYLDAAQQDALLEQAADMVRPGGRLVVRDATLGRGWRSAFTIFVEWISRLVRFNLGERVHVRDVEREYVPKLEAKGLRCTVEPCWHGTPFANVLVVATRPE
jgi:2-polyprenyl-3-methyl-5-hydroxy-6-metoxy-1,4-benzoquinol methylase